MKVIDREGRLFGKVSVIDILVIAVVAVIAVAVHVKNNETPTGVSAVEEQPIVFQVRVGGAEDYLLDAIRVGDKVYDQGYSSGGRPVGEITGVQVLNDPGIIRSSHLQNGSLVDIEVVDTVDLIVTIKGSGVTDGRSYSINRVYELGVNSSRTYRSNRVSFGGTLISITG